MCKNEKAAFTAERAALSGSCGDLVPAVGLVEI
jgi:hypothetical protein